MDRSTVISLLVVAIGVALSLFRSRLPLAEIPRVWIFGAPLALFAGLFFGMLISSESLTWLFGLSLMAALSVLPPLALGWVVGSYLRGRRKSNTERE